MAIITLGSTGITTEKNAFGALPIQRVTQEEAVRLVRKAVDGGITFFDTARNYTDSEEKLGEALRGIRHRVTLATKTGASTATVFWEHLETSLRLLRTDYIDLFQFHNPKFCPVPGHESGLYEAMQEARRQGKVRFIGLTNHRLGVAREAVDSGLYSTVQFPFSYLASEKDLALVRACGERGMGFIAMKGLAGGLLTNSAAAYAFMAGFGHVLPIWGIQREHELDEFLRYVDNPPSMNDSYRRAIQQDKAALSGSFCRGCGYCLPCPAGIDIPNCARLSLTIRRHPAAPWLTDASREKMFNIENCIHCNQCKGKCPYELDTPRLLEENLADYKEILAGKPVV